MPGEGLDGLKSDFGGEKKIRPNLVENGRKYGNIYFYAWEEFGRPIN